MVVKEGNEGRCCLAIAEHPGIRISKQILGPRSIVHGIGPSSIVFFLDPSRSRYQKQLRSGQPCPGKCGESPHHGMDVRRFVVGWGCSNAHASGT